MSPRRPEPPLPPETLTALGGAERAAGLVALVRHARRGQYGPEAADLASMIQVVSTRGLHAADRAERVEREANALAAVVADLLNGADVNAVVNDLPHDARRRVMAYRHATIAAAFAPLAPTPRDQFGRLPEVPPRAAVMRDSVRVVDVESPRE